MISAIGSLFVRKSSSSSSSSFSSLRPTDGLLNRFDARTISSSSVPRTCFYTKHIRIMRKYNLMSKVITIKRELNIAKNMCTNNILGFNDYNDFVLVSLIEIYFVADFIPLSLTLYSITSKGGGWFDI